MPFALLMFQDNWHDVIGLYGYGPTLVIIGIVAYCYLKTLPDLRNKWEWTHDLRKRDLDLRELEAGNRSADVTVRGEEAKALTMLSNVLRDVAVEQRKASESQRSATEITELLQRVNADRSEKLTSGVIQLSERFDRLEKILDVTNDHEGLKTRVTALEQAA